MNYNAFYEIGLVLCIFIPLTILIFVCIDTKHIKFNDIKVNIIIATILIFCLIFAGFCYKNIEKSYSEVYYLEYTIYYPNNTHKVKVDSCNHIRYNSYKGTNSIKYYNIPKKIFIVLILQLLF